jgi:hypothetical protein
MIILTFATSFESPPPQYFGNCNCGEGIKFHNIARGRETLILSELLDLPGSSRVLLCSPGSFNLPSANSARGIADEEDKLQIRLWGLKQQAPRHKVYPDLRASSELPPFRTSGASAKGVVSSTTTLTPRKSINAWRLRTWQSSGALAHQL